MASSRNETDQEFGKDPFIRFTDQINDFIVEHRNALKKIKGSEIVTKIEDILKRKQGAEALDDSPGRIITSKGILSLVSDFLNKNKNQNDLLLQFLGAIRDADKDPDLLNELLEPLRKDAQIDQEEKKKKDVSGSRDAVTSDGDTSHKRGKSLFWRKSVVASSAPVSLPSVSSEEEKSQVKFTDELAKYIAILLSTDSRIGEDKTISAMNQVLRKGLKGSAALYELDQIVDKRKLDEKDIGPHHEFIREYARRKVDRDLTEFKQFTYINPEVRLIEFTDELSNYIHTLVSANSQVGRDKTINAMNDVLKVKGLKGSAALREIDKIIDKRVLEEKDNEPHHEFIREYVRRKSDRGGKGMSEFKEFVEMQEQIEGREIKRESQSVTPASPTQIRREAEQSLLAEELSKALKLSPTAQSRQESVSHTSPKRRGSRDGRVS